jgi:tRNA threonylcarbamoyladenosine biosynthesis protein TsaE
MSVHYPKTPEEMHALGKNLMEQSPCTNLFCFFGPLGAGKTTLIKGIAESLGIPPHHVNSPTFQYLNMYSGRKKLIHFDLWRLKSEKEFFDLGFEEFLSSDVIVCIEWAEKLGEELPEKATKITIRHSSDGGRIVEVGS